MYTSSSDIFCHSQDNDDILRRCGKIKYLPGNFSMTIFTCNVQQSVFVFQFCWWNIKLMFSSQSPHLWQPVLFHIIFKSFFVFGLHTNLYWQRYRYPKTWLSYYYRSLKTRRKIYALGRFIGSPFKLILVSCSNTPAYLPKHAHF